jgi:hypothetical protein
MSKGLFHDPCGHALSQNAKRASAFADALFFVCFRPIKSGAFDGRNQTKKGLSAA